MGERQEALSGAQTIGKYRLFTYHSGICSFILPLPLGSQRRIDQPMRDIRNRYLRKSGIDVEGSSSPQLPVFCFIYCASISETYYRAQLPISLPSCLKSPSSLQDAPQPLASWTDFSTSFNPTSSPTSFQHTTSFAKTKAFASTPTSPLHYGRTHDFSRRESTLLPMSLPTVTITDSHCLLVSSLTTTQRDTTRSSRPLDLNLWQSMPCRKRKRKGVTQCSGSSSLPKNY